MKSSNVLFSSLVVASVYAATSPCAHAAPAPVFTTSFDCTQTKASIEQLICRDAQLARIDVELMRLYRLALTDERSRPPPDKVMIDQQFWVQSRNQCASAADPKACAIRSYAERAHQLRQGSAIVRTRDPDRITEGPVTFRCIGLDTLMAATFITTQPGVVYLKWANTSVTLSQVQSDSGVRYTAKDQRGNFSFWQAGDTARFLAPGFKEMSCNAEPSMNEPARAAEAMP
ncbi:Lipoprotein LprI [Pseudomonas fluorescens]|uniref:Lipoprotein LprI n=1 Tax=Pseudomonas fluorescens TaxID=294 RepID=A0A5E6U3X9_PSEFL|nr:MliC family protein [Pseudomonas fluorescens]VVN00147.1 Lipoprotein LprI [Pseudomonas fluorescens]